MLKDNDIFHTLNLNNIKIISSSKAEVKNFLSKEISNISKEKLIITFNLDFYRNTEINTQFKQICETADYVFPDGIGITFLLRLKYKINVNRITGNHLFTLLLGLAEQFNLKIALVGSTDLTMKNLTIKIRNKYPKINICASETPPLNFEKKDQSNTNIIQKLKMAEPDILFLALGSPRQELWLFENMKNIGSKINMGVGAVFDYYSGSKKRAPNIIRRLGMEWLWRLLTEPIRLFRRYLINDLPFFIQMLFKYIFRFNDR